MAATSWQPILDQDASGSASRIVAAAVNPTGIAASLYQTVLPYATTPMTTWLLGQVGITAPGAPVTTYPPNTGRGYPR
jgi:hypothetical protein